MWTKYMLAKYNSDLPPLKQGNITEKHKQKYSSSLSGGFYQFGG
jgi:hypothetical protein